MTVLLPAAVLLICLGAIRAPGGVFKVLKHAWFWLSGHTHNGYHHTNATWTRRATKVLHPTGNAYEWHWMPRWQRAAVRTGVTLFVFDAAAGLVFARQAALIALSVIVLAALAWIASWVYRKVNRWIPSRRGARR
jgi:hypothetical protein